MSPVCLVTERLFPIESIDDWALELFWRARDLGRAGMPVVVLWIKLQAVPAARLEQARKHYAALGAELVVKEDVAPFLGVDEPVPLGSVGASNLLTFAALCRLHEKRRFSAIEIPAERGLAFRVVQAQRAALAFTDTNVVVTLGNFGEWNRHQQKRLTLTSGEIRIDFCERETVELAQTVVTSQPEKVAFTEGLGWERGRIGTRPLPRLREPEVPEIAPRAVPCFLGDVDEDVGFEQFRQIIGQTKGIPRWLYLEEARSEKAPGKRAEQLAAAAKKSGAEVEIHSNPDWAKLPALLRDQGAFVILHQSADGPRLRWLVRNGIPFVCPAELRDLLPARRREAVSGLAFNGRDPNSLYAAMKTARAFRDWARLLTWWRECLQPVAGEAAAQIMIRSDAPGVHAVEAPRPPTPRVTIAVSHYNLKQLLHETLECLSAQTYPACDVVVVDDGSDDPESQQAWQSCKERFPAFTFQELPHVGYWSPRNHVIEHCTNPYIIIVDGDNLPRPEMAEIFVRAMERNPEFAAFTSYIAAFSEHREAALRGKFDALNAPLGGDIVSGYFGNVFGDTNSIFRIDAIRAIHGFREDFRCAFGDWELFHRLVGQGHRLGVIPKVLLHYRRRAGGMIRQRTLYREHWEFFDVLDAPATLRPADRRRLSFALHGLALNK